MAKDSKTFKVKGLHRYSDVFSSTPEGSLSEAKNTVIDQTNLLSPRRGYEKLTTDTQAGNILLTNPESLMSFKDRLHYQRITGEIAYYDSDNLRWVDYSSTIVKPEGTNRSRFTQANQNIYLTSSNGVQKIQNLGGNIIDSGAPQALAATASLIGGGTTLASGESVAYRIVWGYKDSNNNLILGAPSQRTVVTATAAQDVELTFNIPSVVDTTWFYQIYRSNIVSGGALPSDELFLAFEGNPGVGAQQVHLDTQPQDLLGTPLYTNATQEGLVNSNYEPPQCKDITLFQGHVFYANTQRKSEVILQLLGTGTDGLQAGDTITINGVTYTGVAGAPGANQFEVVTGTGSPSQDVEDTAKSLISQINTTVGSDIEAYYWSEVGTDAFDLAGEIRLVEKDYNLAPTFTVTATAANPVSQVWTPDLTSALAAEPDLKPNRIYYSKFQEPEAVPLGNYFDVGPANSEILRIIPLRTSLLIFTETEIHRLTGTTQAAFQTNLLDNTARLIAEDSAVAFNNAVYGLFDQGVCQVSEAVQVISRPIEGDLLKVLGASGDNLNTRTFGIGYESDRKYIISLPENNTSDTTVINYVYNTVTNTWTSWDKPAIHGIVEDKSDKLAFLFKDRISLERKNFSETDIADEQEDVTTVSVNINSSDQPVIGIDPTVIATTQVGYIYYESATKFSKIIGIDTVGNTITTQDNLNFQLSNLSRSGLDYTLGDKFINSVSDIQDLNIGSVVSGTGIPANTKIVKIEGNSIFLNNEITSTETNQTVTILQKYQVLPFIEISATWNPLYMGAPGKLKQFSEAMLITTSALETVTLGFKTVNSGNFEDIDFNESVLGAWGLFPWGEVPWGGDNQVFRYRTYVPRAKQRDASLFPRVRLNAVFNLFELSGWEIMYRDISLRARR